LTIRSNQQQFNYNEIVTSPKNADKVRRLLAIGYDDNLQERRHD